MCFAAVFILAMLTDLCFKSTNQMDREKLLSRANIYAESDNLEGTPLLQAF